MFRLANIAWMPLVIWSSSLARAEDQHWVITSEQAVCIIEHRQTYADQAGDVIIIVVDACPNPSPFADALSGLQNYRGVGTVETAERTEGLDPIISYTQAQLRCLRTEDIQFSDGIATMPKALQCQD